MLLLTKVQDEESALAFNVITRTLYINSKAIAFIFLRTIAHINNKSSYSVKFNIRDHVPHSIFMSCQNIKHHPEIRTTDFLFNKTEK